MTNHAEARIQSIDALVTFFACADSDQGLRSAGGPGGTFGSRSADYERRILDYRFGLGPAGEGTVTRARAVRSVLQSLPSASVDVLYAKHGPTPWGRIIDAAFGVGMSIKVTARLGDLAGVALLAPSVARGYAAAPSTAARRVAWNTPGGWLVALCMSGKPEARTEAARIKGEAVALLADAEGLFLDARGVQRAALTRAQLRPPRRPSVAMEAGL